jgi:hypothetical protein
MPNWYYYWVPFLGFRVLPKVVVEFMELDDKYVWSGFLFSWRNFSYIWLVRAIGPVSEE